MRGVGRDGTKLFSILPVFGEGLMGSGVSFMG